jgi:hypothetical protein
MLDRLAALGRTSRFRRGRANVRCRRNLAVRPHSSEGQESTLLGHSAFRAGNGSSCPIVLKNSAAERLQGVIA